MTFYRDQLHDGALTLFKTSMEAEALTGRGLEYLRKQLTKPAQPNPSSPTSSESADGPSGGERAN